MNNPPDIAARLKKLRKEAGLSQEEFAKKLFLSRGRYNGLETGRETPSAWVIQQINLLERLGVDLVNKVKLAPEPGPQNFSVAEEPAGYDELDTIREQLLRKFSGLIVAAGNNRDRLGWISVQLAAYLTPPPSWEEEDARSTNPHHLSPVHAQVAKKLTAAKQKLEMESSEENQSSSRKTQGGAGR